MSQATARGISLCPTAALPPARPDAIFGDDFPEHVRHMGICEVLSASRSPWQRAYIERVIGSVRRQCLDHMIVSTKARYEERCNRTTSITTDRERIFRWERTRRSHEQFTRPKWDPS